MSRIIQIPPVFVDEASSLQYDVPVKNETDQTVQFTHIRRSCTCAGATRLAAMKLAPGQETTLHFDIDLHHRMGPQQFVCYLVEASGAEWTYSLATTLYERARFAQSEAIHFGMVDPKTEEVRETQFYLHAENRQALPHRVSFRTDSDPLQVEAGLGSVDEKPDGTVVWTFPLTLRLRQPGVPGLERASVYAEVEQPGGKQIVQTNVTWNVRALYVVAPSQVYFGTIDPSAPGEVERRVVIRRTDARPLGIKGVKVSCSSVRCSIEKMSDDSTGKVLLVLNPRSMTGALWGEMTVETDHAVQPLLKIPVAALTKPAK
jgi:hypothetical protein